MPNGHWTESVSLLHEDVATARREAAEWKAIAETMATALRRVRDGWGEPWQALVCDAIAAFERKAGGEE